MLAAGLLGVALSLGVTAPRALYDAACQGKLERVKRLLATEAGRAQLDEAVDEDFTSYSMNPLGCAASSLNVDVVRALLAAGARPNPAAAASPLFLALQRAREERALEVARLLVRAGADPNLPNNARDLGGDSLLEFAAGNGGGAALMKLLLDAGVDPAHACGAAFTAMLEHNPAPLAFLVERGGGCPGSPLLLGSACHLGRTEELRVLLDHGARVEARDERGRTPLLDCLHNGSAPPPAALELLLERGANLKAQEEDGCGALCASAFIGGDDGATFTWLMGKGLDPRRECAPILARVRGAAAAKVAELTVKAGCSLADAGGPLLRRAAEEGSTPLVRWLLAHGVAVDEAGKGGRTALHLALAHRQEEAVQALLDGGADPRRKDAAGHDALELGAETSLAIQRLLGTDEVSRLRREPIAAIILGGSGKTPDDAQAAQKRFGDQAKALEPAIGLAQGYPVSRRSDDVPGLRPGHHVVVLGYCLQSEVDGAVEVLKSFFPDAYSRPVQAKLDAPACPALRLPVQARKTVKGPDGSQLVTSVLAEDPLDAIALGREKAVLVHAALISREGKVLAAQGVDVGRRWTDGGCALTLAPGKGAIAAALRCSGGFVEMCSMGPFTDRVSFETDGSEIRIEEKHGSPRTIACGE